MLKTAPEYAKLMLDLCNGDRGMAQRELFNAVKAYGDKVPNKFWVDVFYELLSVDGG